MYNRGTLAEFNTWHATTMTAEGISLPGGKIGSVNGKPAPGNQRTIAYSSAIAHPINPDDYRWVYGDHIDGTSLSVQDVISLGFITEE